MAELRNFTSGAHSGNEEGSQRCWTLPHGPVIIIDPPLESQEAVHRVGRFLRHVPEAWVSAKVLAAAAEALLTSEPFSVTCLV